MRIFLIFCLFVYQSSLSIYTCFYVENSWSMAIANNRFVDLFDWFICIQRLAAQTIKQSLVNLCHEFLRRYWKCEAWLDVLRLLSQTSVLGSDLQEIRKEDKKLPKHYVLHYSNTQLPLKFFSILKTFSFEKLFAIFSLTNHLNWASRRNVLDQTNKHTFVMQFL